VAGSHCYTISQNFNRRGMAVSILLYCRSLHDLLQGGGKHCTTASPLTDHHEMVGYLPQHRMPSHKPLRGGGKTRTPASLIADFHGLAVKEKMQHLSFLETVLGFHQ